MNIMKLIPQKEYERMKEKNSPISTKRAAQINPNEEKNTCINQLNQTKVEDGGRQTIINTCKKDDDGRDAPDFNTKVDFPDDNTFDNIDRSKPSLESDDDAKSISQIKERDLDDKNTSADEVIANIDNLTGNKLADNLDYEVDSPEIAEGKKTPLPYDMSREGEEGNSPDDKGQDIRDDKTELEKKENDEPNLNNIPNTQDEEKQSAKILPSTTSPNLDEKYEVWKDRNQYNYDSELWQNENDDNKTKQSLTDDPENEKDDIDDEDDREYKNPRNPKLRLSPQRKKPEVIKKRTTPYSRTRKTATGGLKKTRSLVSTYLKPNSKTPVENMSIPSSNHSIEKIANQHIDYSSDNPKSERTKPKSDKGAVKKTSRAKKKTKPDSDSEQMKKKEIELMLQKEIGRLNEDRQNTIQTKGGAKKPTRIIKKKDNMQLDDEQMKKREIELMLKREIDKLSEKEESEIGLNADKLDYTLNNNESDNIKKSSRKRTDKDWLPAKVQGRVALKAKLKTRAQNVRENMRNKELDNRRNIKPSVSVQYDTPEMTDLTRPLKKTNQDEEANKIIEDLLDPKRPKLIPKTPKISNYTIWNQHRK